MKTPDRISPDEQEKIPEPIARSMALADLQVKMMGFKMSEATPEAIDALFEEFEDNETAQRLKENMLNILNLRDQFSDEELAEKLLGFKPSAFMIIATPVAFDIIFYSMRDWDKFRNKKDKTDIIKHHLFVGGLSRMTDLRVDKDGKKQIPINCYSLVHHPSWAIFIHEARHAINKITGCSKALIEDPLGETEKSKIIESIIEATVNYKLNNLKDEVSSYLAQGASKLKLKLWTFRSRYALGLYNFKNMPKNYWVYMQENYLLNDEDMEKIKKEVIKRMNISEVTDNAFSAVKLLQQKGYSRDWAVSFLCTEENFMKDWLEVAQTCPKKQDGAL